LLLLGGGSVEVHAGTADFMCIGPVESTANGAGTIAMSVPPSSSVLVSLPLLQHIHHHSRWIGGAHQAIERLTAITRKQ
jgi:hypothetical protein